MKTKFLVTLFNINVINFKKNVTNFKGRFTLRKYFYIIKNIHLLMKPKLIFLYSNYLLLSLLIGIVSSCRNEQKPKIGFLLPNLLHDRYQKEKIFFSDRINSLGGEAIIESANNDDKIQIQQTNNLIKKDISVLVVNSVNLYTAAAIVRAAHEKGIMVIAYDRLICNSDVDYYLSFDNEKVGKLMADYAINKIPDGKYLIFGGDRSDLNAVLVNTGQLKSLEPLISSGKIKIDYNVYIEDWSEENAGHELKRYLNLSNSKPDVILSSFDGMSNGIIKTLKEFGFEGQVLVTGQDAELEACKNIVNGFQTMTVYKPIKKLAYTAAELSMKLVHTKSLTETNSKIFNGFKDVPSVLLEPISVDKENLVSTVIADGYLSASDINN